MTRTGIKIKTTLRRTKQITLQVVQGKDDFVRIPSGVGIKWTQDILNMSCINFMPKNLNCNAIIVTMEGSEKI